MREGFGRSRRAAFRCDSDQTRPSFGTLNPIPQLKWCLEFFLLISSRHLHVSVFWLKLEGLVFGCCSVFVFPDKISWYWWCMFTGAFCILQGVHPKFWSARVMECDNVPDSGAGQLKLYVFALHVFYYYFFLFLKLLFALIYMRAYTLLRMINVILHNATLVQFKGLVPLTRIAGQFL